MFSDICMWNGMIVEVVVNKNSRLCKQLWLSHLTINQMKSIVFSECWTIPLRVWLRGKKYRPMLNKWVTPFDGADLSHRTNWGQMCSFWSLLIFLRQTESSLTLSSFEKKNSSSISWMTSFWRVWSLYCCGWALSLPAVICQIYGVKWFHFYWM